MSDFYTCPDCGAEYERKSNHQAVCPGSPQDNIDALQERVEKLEEAVILLLNHIHTGEVYAISHVEDLLKELSHE